MRKTLAILSAVFIIANPPLQAVEHLHPGTYPHAFKDNIHHPSAAQIHRAGSLRAAVLASSTGTKKVAVIAVQFTGKDSSLVSGSASILSISNVNAYFNQLKAYYNEVSYGKLQLNVRFFNSNNGNVDGDAALSSAGVYTLPHPEEYYGCGDEGIGCAGVSTPDSGTRANGDYLIRDALQAVMADHSNSPVNSSVGTPGTSGVFDSVVVIHAGNGNETSGANGDIWSIFYSQEDQGTSDGIIGQAGQGWNEGDVVPETETGGITSPLGVICHEYGHELGLPDLYNTGFEGGAPVDGSWELMDSGPFDGDGANPSHPSAWDKYYLGWAVPQVFNGKGSGSVGYSEVSDGSKYDNMLLLPVSNGSSQEYFLAEYRSRSAGPGVTYDKQIPGSGLLIWHVDDAITHSRGVAVTDPSLTNTVNSGVPHYGVSLVTADGSAISGTDTGHASQAYTNGAVFSTPQSDNFAGQSSGILIANISGVGTAALSFSIADLAVAAEQAIEKLINFPNPAGKGYPHPKGDGYTTIQFQLARPAADCQINIYTLSGDLVRRIGKDDINLNLLNRSANDKFVYEYDWDLTNGEGRKVAPGVYLYLLRADGKTQTGKAVIIR